MGRMIFIGFDFFHGFTEKVKHNTLETVRYILQTNKNLQNVVWFETGLSRIGSL